MSARGPFSLLTTLFAALSCVAAAQAQPFEAAPAPAKDPHTQALTLGGFLRKVAESNLELLAQRLSVPIADAQIAVARMFPDPQVTGGVSQVDVSGQGAPLVSTLGVTLPLEVGGKRGARVALATADAQVARAELDDFLRTLRGGAASAYIDALYARLLRDRKQRTLESLEKLVSINQQRLRVGDIGEVALLQSRVEAERFRGEVLAAQAEVRAAELKVVQFLGKAYEQQDPRIGERLVGDLRISARGFDEEKLVARARSERPDVRAARLGMDSARARVRLAQANRYTDLGLNVSWQRSLSSEPFASPAYDALTATATLTLPFSRVYRGELDAARHGEDRSQHQLGGVELRAEVEVRTALVRYRAAADQVKLYTQGVLADADQVLAATLYTYQRGSATQLEVLTAQRTVDEVYLAYYGALAEHARQLVLVEQAAGIWDISF
jgi:cobalt-zinc-cadmium efflux system outer membrane protein